MVCCAISEPKMQNIRKFVISLTHMHRRLVKYIATSTRCYVCRASLARALEQVGHDCVYVCVCAHSAGVWGRACALPRPLQCWRGSSNVNMRVKLCVRWQRADDICDIYVKDLRLERNIEFSKADSLFQYDGIRGKWLNNVYKYSPAA